MASVPPRANMPEHFGIRIVSAEKDKVVGEIDADGRHLNNRGIVHGGAYMAFADDVGGATAGLNLMPGMSTTTIESKSNFFRASPPGRLTAISVPLHVGRRTIVVQTSIYGADGKLAAMVTQTQLVIPRAPKE
jgi:1,4-dihydroxy-2-naphthoyl-CoA hydrolase